MKFEIENKDKDGNVLFSGSLTKDEATFIFNIGISYLLARGVLPIVEKAMEDEQVDSYEQSSTLQ